MKAKVGFFNFVMAVVFFMAAPIAWAAIPKSGTIVLESTKHIILFRVLGNKVDGLIDGTLKRRVVSISDIKSINFDGSTVDVGTSVVTLVNSTQAVAVITGTPEKEDQGGIWNVELKSTGEKLAFDPARWNFRGLTITALGLVRYGSGGGPVTPKKSRMDFTGGKLVIHIGGSDPLHPQGFISGINLADVQDFRWSSDKKGWGDGSIAVAVLPRDNAGSPIMPVVVTITGLDPDDNGNVVIKKKDGTLVWCNIGSDAWEFSSNVKLDQINGRIIFTGNK